MESSVKQPVQVFAEVTPNPAALKFVVDRRLTKEGESLDLDAPEKARGRSPLAEAIFQYPFVKRVFIMDDFLTVTRHETVEWDEVMREVREFIRDQLDHGVRPVEERKEDREEEPVAPSDGEEKAAPVTSLFGGAEASPHDERIRELLREHIAPAVQGDGGMIRFHSFHDGVVKLELKGACAGCPSASLTMKNGIEALLKRYVPEVERVEALEA